MTWSWVSGEYVEVERVAEHEDVVDVRVGVEVEEHEELALLAQASVTGGYSAAACLRRRWSAWSACWG